MPLPQYFKYENICKSTHVLVIIIYIIFFLKNGSSMQQVNDCDGGTYMPLILVLKKVVSSQPKGARRMP